MVKRKLSLSTSNSSFVHSLSSEAYQRNMNITEYHRIRSYCKPPGMREWCDYGRNQWMSLCCLRHLFNCRGRHRSSKLLRLSIHGRMCWMVRTQFVCCSCTPLAFSDTEGTVEELVLSWCLSDRSWRIIWWGHIHGWSHFYPTINVVLLGRIHYSWYLKTMVLASVIIIVLWSCIFANFTFWPWIFTFLQVQLKSTVIWEHAICLLLVVDVPVWEVILCSYIQWTASTNKQTQSTWGPEWVLLITVTCILSNYL